MIGWAWRASAQVDPNWKLRAKFALAALKDRALAHSLQHVDPQSPLGQLLTERPETIGNLIWPYQCAAWDAKTRFARISTHLEAIEKLPALKVEGDEKIVFADLTSLSPNTFVMIDYSPWLAREGHLTLSLFKGDFRAFTIAFSLSNWPQTELFIGGIQGRNDDRILDMYRDFTKEFHGVRPRDLMLELLRLFALRIGVQHIYAVADDHKISRHAYFGKKGTVGLNYDDVWVERGGSRIAPTHFELPLSRTRRDLNEVAAKKRSMYRRRYEMFDQLEASLPHDLALAERRRFAAS
ncbi:MAG: DUF535 family protein [Sphingomonas sp.]|nr:DUF535 family protein [Sphingomonas sp.]